MFNPNFLKSTRNLVAVTALSALALSAAGCDNGEVKKIASCKVFNTKGTELHPSVYPTGVFTVEFQEAVSVGNTDESTTGVIRKTNDGYILDVKSLPERLSNDYTYFAGTHGAFGVTTPQTGEIVLSSNCISRTVENGIPTAVVTLPFLAS